MKDPVEAPAATVTCDGTLAAVSLLAKVTTMPPVGAEAFRVTDPFVLPPDVRLDEVM